MGKSYVIGVFICPYVYPSLNITYHQQNTICNSISELIVAVTFTVILFQLSLEYTDEIISLVTPSIIF